MSRVGDVFVVGSLPTVTYNPRSARQLEDRVENYLEDRGTILSVSGPTKCGKTVLIRTVAGAEAIYLTGADVPSVEAFWGRLADELGVATHETRERGNSTASNQDDSFGGTVGVPGIASISLGVGEGEAKTATSGRSQSREVSAAHAARKRLREVKNPVIVDDFHYIPSPVQLDVVRGIKDLVFDRVPFIFAAIPHRAYDVVRVENEMTGRVTQVSVPFWTDDELNVIADKGFNELNVTGSSALLGQLVTQAFSSPHLMQQFCRELCRRNGVNETSATQARLRFDDSEAFFREQAVGTSRMAFQMLAQGPQQRTDRNPRHLKSGTVVDIYGLVLLAVAHTGPLTELKVDDLRSAIREISADEPPQLHEVTRVLDAMTNIARTKIEGEPVVDFDRELGTLHISDPFFAYFLRWGAQELVPTRQA
jgi:CBS domain-containing protein